MIKELLKEGKENKISFNHLMQATGSRSERHLRRMIADERKKGAIILSCPEGGYYLPSDRKEVESYIYTMSKEAKSILNTLKHCRKYLKEAEGQLQFNLNE